MVSADTSQPVATAGEAASHGKAGDGVGPAVRLAAEVARADPAVAAAVVAEAEPRTAPSSIGAGEPRGATGTAMVVDMESSSWKGVTLPLASGVPAARARDQGASDLAGGRIRAHPAADRPFDPATARPYIRRVRYLGIDLGRARIGLAVADDVLRSARPLRAVERHGEAADLRAIGEVAEDFEVTRAVVGLPLNMDGTEGPSARLARAFAPRLSEALGVPVELFDERLSTFEAEDRLRARGVSARDQKGLVDAEAAAVILQGWLDGRDA